MRRHLFAVSLVVVGFAGGLVAARLAPAALQGPGGGRGGFGTPGIFQLLDTNSDQALSSSEIEGAIKVLTSRDANHDGRLTADELPASGRGGRRGGDFGGPGRGEGPAQSPGADAEELVSSLMGFDKNNDQKLTRDEVPERMQGLFDRADLDKNGQLTADEIRKSAAAQPQSGEGEGRRGGGPGGDRFGRGGAFGGGGRPGGPGGRDAILSVADANGNGVVESDELAALPRALRALDRNGDGSVTRDEIMGGRSRGRGPSNESI